YLRFTEKRKISFAASIGKTELSESEEAIVKEYLSDYSYLTVRETSAVSLLDSMGIKSEVILDPTLQIEKEHWISMASKRLIKEKYLILMLLYREDNNATEYARKIADEKGLKLVKISWELKKPPYVDILMTHRKPEDFLSLFYNAEYVVTNSFHGLAFSINLNKQFVVIKRNEFNSRIDSLLEMTGLTERLVDYNLDMDIVNKEIDYNSVNDILNAERIRTQNLIQENING
ncbi:MAG: polysaccharide pyruvyl transferase family protein, partial [Clostridia bacterium]|nr:polysaccharide pyruvyl transferase family protein [Clostridia bacterium]